MKPQTRLKWVVVVITASIAYTFLVILDSDVAQALMLGYVGLLLTVFVVNEVWKSHE